MTTVLFGAVIAQMRRHSYSSSVEDDSWKDFMVLITEDATVRTVYAKLYQELITNPKNSTRKLRKAVEEYIKKIERIGGFVPVEVVRRSETPTWWEKVISYQPNDNSIIRNNENLARMFQRNSLSKTPSDYLSFLDTPYSGTLSIGDIVKKHKGKVIIAMCMNESEILHLMWKEYDGKCVDVIVVEDIIKRVGSSLFRTRKGVSSTIAASEVVIWENLLTLLPLAVNVGLPNMLFSEPIRSADLIYSMVKRIQSIEGRIINGMSLSLNRLRDFVKIIALDERSAIQSSQHNKSSSSMSSGNEHYVNGKEWGSFKVRFYGGNFSEEIETMVLKRCNTYVESLIYFHLIFRYSSTNEVIERFGPDVLIKLKRFEVTLKETVLAEDLLTYITELMFHIYDVMEEKMKLLNAVDDNRNPNYRDESVTPEVPRVIPKSLKIKFNEGTYMSDYRKEDDQSLIKMEDKYGELYVGLSTSNDGRSQEEGDDRIRILGRLVPYHPSRYEDNVL